MLFNQVMRYVPTLRYLLRMNPTRILEVGSGSNGLGPYWNRPVTGCDIRFSEPLHSLLQGVVASAEALPFSSNAFECVCSLDMIEHLNPDKRLPALTEMARVASHVVLVAYPAGRGAQWSDRAIMRFYKWRGGQPPDWLGEHLRAEFPDGREVLSLVHNGGWRLSRAGNENLVTHLLGILLETRAWFYYRAGDYVKRHYWLISLLSIGPCYRQMYFLEKPIN